MFLPVGGEGSVPGALGDAASARQLETGVVGVVVDAERELDGAPGLAGGLGLGDFRPGDGGFDKPRAVFMAHRQLAAFDRAVLRGFRLARIEVLVRHAGRLQPPDLGAAAVALGDGVERELVVGGGPDGVSWERPRRAEIPGLLFRRQDVEGDLHVVAAREVAGGQLRVFAVGVAADAFRPDERTRRLRVVLREDGEPRFREPGHGGGGRVEIRILVQHLVPGHAGMRRGVQRAHGDVEEIVVGGQVAFGVAVAVRGGGVDLEGQPGRLGAGGTAGRRTDDLGRNVLPLPEVAIDGDRALRDRVDAQVFGVADAPVGAGVEV